jgi:four helix bundle protein
MGKIESYKDLDVWRQSRDLVIDIYQVTKLFPKEEQFGLTNQLRRASVSIPSNIAEGCGRNHQKDSIQFFFIARGSLYEVETQLIIALDLGYLSKEEQTVILNKITSCKRLLNGFINYFQDLSGQQPTTINEQLEEYGNSNTN